MIKQRRKNGGAGRLNGFFYSAKKKAVGSTKFVVEQFYELINDFKSAKSATQIILVVAAVVAVGFCVITYVRANSQVEEQQQILVSLQGDIENQKKQNEIIEKKMTEDYEIYAETVAREKLGMVYPGERIFINRSGD